MGMVKHGQAQNGDFRRQVLVRSYSTARALEFDRLCWDWIRSITLELGKQKFRFYDQCLLTTFKNIFPTVLTFLCKDVFSEYVSRQLK